MIKKTLFLILTIVSLSGCVTTNTSLNTPTGRPEIQITGMTKKEITDAIINQMLSWEFQLQKQEESILVFNKKNTSLSGAVLFGSKYDSTPEWRFTYNLVNYSDGTRVVAHIASVTNPGSAFERITDLSKGSQDSKNVQSFFESLKTYGKNNEKVKNRGKVGILIKDINEIVDVLNGSPAETAGIRKGDIILKIDDIPVSNNQMENVMRITGDPGTTITLLIKRDGQEILIPIVRGNP